MDSAQISQQFAEYYKARGFYLLPRAPMLDPSIPMSFVMSAGLVQIETSLAQSSNRPGNQFVLVQNCFRHFDLETVGKDSTHLSFFEMPGAFTFGPNNKAETIQHMWLLATSILGIDRDRIWATYFKGGDILQNSLPEDISTREIWLNLGIPANRIVGLETNNYWIQGRGIENMVTPRKCGPNTELFFDRGIEKACGPNCKPGCGCDRFIEFSNSLFISHEIDKENMGLTPIPEPFTETVIGTERVAMILQDVPSVFDIDSYSSIINTIRTSISRTGLPESMRTVSEKVVADYTKALYYLIADGAPPPGKNGRERIIKLLIRGVLTHQNILGISAPDFLFVLLDRVASIGAGGSEKNTTRKRVLDYFMIESPRFTQTIERGQRTFFQLLEENHGNTLSGSQITYLEKILGLPHGLVAVLLWERGLPFLEPDYHQALKNWKQTTLN
jgi:alanyl-tRNA synthetase